MPTNYFADLEKLTEKELEIINGTGREDTLRLFYKPSAVLSIEMHKALCGLHAKVEYYPVQSETEISLFAGMIYGSDLDAENILLTELPMSDTVKSILKITSCKKPVQKRTRAKKTCATEAVNRTEVQKSINGAADNAEHKKLYIKEDTKGIVPKQAKNNAIAPKTGVSTELKRERKRASKTEESPYESESDKDLFHRYCAISQDMDDRDAVIDDIAKIFFLSMTAEAAIDNVCKKYGKEIADVINEKAGILIRFTKGGATK